MKVLSLLFDIGRFSRPCRAYIFPLKEICNRCSPQPFHHYIALVQPIDGARSDYIFHPLFLNSWAEKSLSQRAI